MNLTDSMAHDAALVLAAWWRSRTDPTLDEQEHGRPLPDPTPWLPLARNVLTAALADVLAREGEVYRPDVAELERLRAEVAGLKAEVARLEGRVPAYARLPKNLGAA